MSCGSGKVVVEVVGREVHQVLQDRQDRRGRRVPQVLLRLGAREGRQAVEARLLGMSLPFRSSGV
jgi:hypothetical protein